MNVYTKQDENAFILTTGAGSFNALLKHYLLPLGWSIANEEGFTLYLENSNHYIAKIKNIENKAYLTGFRHLSDTVGFPSSSQMLIDGEVAVVSSQNIITTWKLFANSESFYFILNGELLAFGSYEPLFNQEEQLTHFVIGNQYYLGNQTLIVQPNQLTTMLFLESTFSQFPFSRAGGLSIPSKAEEYHINPQLLVASPVAIHEEGSYLRGFLPDLFIFNPNYSQEGFIYSQGGYVLYGVIMDDRCYGVKIN